MYRSSYRAYDGVNNLFNLAYRILFWKCYRGLIHAHLEPYLGFLHKMEHGRPSMVCDYLELYRHLVDGFLIEFCKNLGPDDFKPKNVKVGKKKVGKRVYLKDSMTKEMVHELFDYFETKFYIPRPKRGRRQELETLINEEAFRISRYLRLKGESWVPARALTNPLSPYTHARVETDIHAIVGGHWGLSASRLKGNRIVFRAHASALDVVKSVSS
jgi:CRISPR-associated protein Cas1